MESTNPIQWLLECGGPVIRYRTALELVKGASEPDLAAKQAVLLEDPTVQRWLGNIWSYEEHVERQKLGQGLGEGGNSSFLHGSTDWNLEVVLPKLGQLGLRAGHPVLDEKTVSWRLLLAEELASDPQQVYPQDAQFLLKVYAYYDRRLILASALALAGYTWDPGVRQVVASRLDAIHTAIQEVSYAIYAEPGSVKIHPKAWSDRVLKWELYSTGEIRLPFIHDLAAFAVFYPQLDGTAQKKVAAIVDWILGPEHQRFLYNFGYIRCPDGRGKSVGRRMDFPGYDGFAPAANSPTPSPGALVMRLWQMAHFPTARTHPWFQAALELLESFAMGNGRYQFPREYLPEARGQGYWVHGERMGLGENRQKPAWREIESTFWMLHIRRKCSQ